MMKFDNMDINEEFVESTTSKLKHRKNSVKDINFTKEEVKEFYIYPLTSLMGNSFKSGIQTSREKITICCTQIDLGIKVNGFLNKNESFSLNELSNPLNPGEGILKNIKSFEFTITEKINFNMNYLYLLTEEQITLENFSSLEKYVNNNLEPPLFDEDDQETTLIFQQIEDLSNSYKIVPIKIILSKPIINKIKQFNFKSPKSCFIGNIKLFDNEGKLPKLIAKENTIIFPKLIYPTQVAPSLCIVDYWNSRQIVSLKEIFNFLDSKGIKYNQEFSLQDFLKLGKEQPSSKSLITNASELQFTFIYDGDFVTPGFGEDEKFTNWEKSIQLRVGENKIFPNREKGNSLTGDRDLIHSGSVDSSSVPISVNYSLHRASKLKAIKDIVIQQVNMTKSSEAFEQLKKMLTFSYWKDREFDNAIDIIFIEKENRFVEIIKNSTVYKIRKQFEGQDRYDVVTNIWLSWKKQHPNIVQNSSEIIRRIEATLAMLSGAVKCNYSINKGDNDDYKILLPWYFEITNNLDEPNRDGYYEYLDIKVKLKSKYGIFTENSFNFNDNIISSNKIYELEYNNFIFPELTNRLENSTYPSMTPINQDLANGEYSKYFVKRITNLKDEIKELYKNYGQGNMNFDWFNDDINNKGSFMLEKESFIDEVVITSMGGYGVWELELIDELNNIFKFELNLFNKNNKELSLASLIL